MKTVTREWVEKAEGDYRTAGREILAEPPNYDAAAFHAQQCAEKYLKARMVEAGIAFPKMHDLTSLLKLLPPSDPEWEALRPKLDALTSLGIEVRYPGVSADAEDAQEALETARIVRSLVRNFLGIDG
jgi:HEPN domain-containing protein